MMKGCGTSGYRGGLAVCCRNDGGAGVGVDAKFKALGNERRALEQAKSRQVQYNQRAVCVSLSVEQPYKLIAGLGVMKDERWVKTGG
jgi:hypothetical protein